MAAISNIMVEFFQKIESNHMKSYIHMVIKFEDNLSRNS